MILRFSFNSLKIIKNTQSLRCISTTSNLKCNSQVRGSENKPDDGEKWTTIYRLPQIRIFSTANKIKIHQGILALLSSPLAWVAETTSNLPEGTFTAVTTIGVTGFLSLTAFSLLLRNVVGFIYLDSTGKRIKLAYVGFLGERKEAILSADDVVRADDLPPLKYKFFYPLSFRNSKDKFVVFYRGGSLQDQDKFGMIFGYDLL
ncbi:uncharacterized protein LOC129799025 [Phlebotomus papatasi]|uniref:uncharacterized protein LOC129799025 n=1 Tax=Phlebotomus papatasi TaxID=29031 RepID=UPI00248452F8|nr:uncharacterized protein LOC129799025 [Phlebotomus papatasi]